MKNTKLLVIDFKCEAHKVDVRNISSNKIMLLKDNTRPDEKLKSTKWRSLCKPFLLKTDVESDLSK